MALFLTRALKLPIPQDTDIFDDTDDLAPAAVEAIAAIAEAGITTGCNSAGTHFCPHRPVRRSHMALFLTRALKLPIPQDTDIFDDTDDLAPAAVEAIAAIAEAGITTGCNSTGTLYCPHKPVKRSQMAAFLARALDL